MIFEIQLNNSYRNLTGYNLTGCKRLFITESKNVKGYGFEGRQISALSMTGTFSMFENLSNITYTVKAENSRNGTLYAVDVTFSVSGIKADASYMLESLLNNELTVIVEDRNGRYWLTGFAQGFISDYESKTEEGSYTVKMSTRQINKPEEISASGMSKISIAGSDNTSTPAPIFTVPTTTTDGGSSGSGNGSSVNVTVVNQNNYILKSTDEFILLPQSYNVYLPSTAQEGKRYIIKADYNASLRPSYIRVITGDIDGWNEAALDTDKASMTVVYDGSGSWHTVAFAQ